MGRNIIVQEIRWVGTQINRMPARGVKQDDSRTSLSVSTPSGKSFLPAFTVRMGNVAVPDIHNKGRVYAQFKEKA